MSVLNRSMFQRPMPVVRREEGSPSSGEKGMIAKFLDYITGDAATTNIPNSYVLNEAEFSMLYPNVDINTTTVEERTISTDSDEYKRLVGITNRAEGSPPQGEMVEEQVDVENVGIMDGFNQSNPEQVAEQVVAEGEQSKEAIDSSDTYDELMRAIRGDNLSESDRRQELASVVGEQDAEKTPDSVLVLVQPVMQMLDQDTANTGIANIESGDLQMPQQPVGIASGGMLRKIPKYADSDADGVTKDDTFDINALLAYMEGNKPNLQTSFDERLPLYQSIISGPNLGNRDADALMSLSKAGFGLREGLDPAQAASLFFDDLYKKGKVANSQQRTMDTQIKLAALKAAEGDVALAKQLEGALEKARLTKTTPKDTKGTSYIVGQNVEIPESFSNVAGLTEKISSLPEGTTIFVDANNKPSITLPNVPNKEAYFDTNQGKVVYYTDAEFNNITDTTMFIPVAAGFTFVKIKKGEGENVEIKDISIDQLRTFVDQGWEVVPNSEIKVEKDKGVTFNAKGGPIVKRSDGTPSGGENSLEYYENILNDAQGAIDAGKIFQAGTETDRSFFNSLYTAAYDGINELKKLKELIAEDPGLVGYTGVFKQSLNKFAGFINDMDNLMGDKVFPDDGTGLGSAIKYVTDKDIASVKSSVEQLSDAIADIISLRGKRGTTKDVREKADKRANVVTMNSQEIILDRVDKLTDFLVDKTKLFGVLSGNYDENNAKEFYDNMETIRINLKEITPDNYSGKKNTFTIEELQEIVGG